MLCDKATISSSIFFISLGPKAKIKIKALQI